MSLNNDRYIRYLIERYFALLKERERIEFERNSHGKMCAGCSISTVLLLPSACENQQQYHWWGENVKLILLLEAYYRWPWNRTMSRFTCKWYTGITNVLFAWSGWRHITSCKGENRRKYSVCMCIAKCARRYAQHKGDDFPNVRPSECN